MALPSPPTSPEPADSLSALSSRLDLITRTAHIGYWSASPGAERAHWSPELHRLHGQSPDSPVPTLSEWLERFVHPEDRDAVAQAFRTPPDERSVESHFRIVRSDGQVLELLTRTVVEGTVPLIGMFGVVIDVTRLRATERALRDAEGRVALVARTIEFGTWEVDLHSGEAFWDDRMWLLRGRLPQRQAPNHAERLAMLHPDDRQTVDRANLAGGPQNYRFRVCWPDGQVRWIESRASSLHDERGRPTRRIGLNWDVTASRQAEVTLREQELALRASQERGRLLGRISHELRTPLNAILGWAQLLGDALEQPDPPGAACRQHARQIQQAGQQLLSMVDKVLELTGEAGAADRPPVPAHRASAPGPHTVLYIEDNAVNAMIVSELVARRSDLRIEVAYNGSDGVQAALRLQPALVLLDMQLPDIDGDEVFRRLKADPRTAAIPCIALSANALASDIEAARCAGLADYWTKPLDFRAFMQAMERYFGPPPPASPPPG